MMREGSKILNFWYLLVKILVKLVSLYGKGVLCLKNVLTTRTPFLASAYLKKKK